MKTLVVAEKEIAAARIAQILSGGKAKEGSLGKVRIFRWKEEEGEWVVLGLRGHVVALDYPKEHRRWSARKLPELIWVPPRKVSDSTTRPIVQALKKVAQESDLLVVATDFDREGELIGLEAVELAREVRPDLPVKRARFSALTKEEVEKAFQNLVELDLHLARSAEARQIVDLVWGAVLTRFLSLAARRRGEDFLSVGRVQSPTLALLVGREKEIESFVPTPYFEVGSKLVTERGEEISALHARGRFPTKEEAQEVAVRAKGASQAQVRAIERSERVERPPEPFHTTSFLRAATALGLSAARAMSIAEDLYTRGYISYPRTDNTVYPPSEDLRAILRRLSKPGSPFLSDVERILSAPTLQPTRGRKVSTDHPPIHPVDLALRSDLGEEEWKVYELVVRRFLATLSPPAVHETVQVEIDVGGEPFLTSGRRIKVEGFRAVYPYGRSKDVEIPPLREGEILSVLDVSVESKKTQPPKRWSQGKLVEIMEEHHLGTKATRAEIIDKLYKRDYIRENPPRPTPLGIAVTEALSRHAPRITRPEMTARLEEEMDAIAEGRIPLERVVEDSRQLLEGTLVELESHREAIGEEIRQALLRKDALGACPKCKEGTLLVRRSRQGKRFVGCSRFPSCDSTYPLPQGGRIEAFEERCPRCEAPGIRVLRKGRAPWVTCLTMGCEGLSTRPSPSPAPPPEERVPPEEVEPEDVL